MKIHLYPLIILFFFSLSTSLSAQRDSLIEIKNNIWTGTKFHHNKKFLKARDIKKVLASNGQALKTFNQGRTLQNIAIVPSAVGGFFIGWPIGEIIAKKADPKISFFAIGGGLVIGSILLTSAGTKKVKSAIDIYNNQYATTLREQQTKIELRMVSNQNGVGVVLSF